MLFWLKKALTYCIMPLPASLALVLVGIGISRGEQHRRLGRGMVWLGILVLLLASHRQVGLRLLAPLEEQYPAQPEFTPGMPIPADLAACQYIVVLGGGHADRSLLPATSKLSVYALGRMTEGVRLSRILPSAKIITTGPSSPGGNSHSSVVRAAAISLGVDPTRIFENTQGRDTENEALALRDTIGDAPFALVTSAWHMPRAMGLMRTAGLNPVACPADFHAKGDDQFRWTNWLWGLDGLENTSWAIYERLGTFWAKLRGRIA